MRVNGKWDLKTRNFKDQMAASKEGRLWAKKGEMVKNTFVGVSVCVCVCVFNINDKYVCLVKHLDKWMDGWKTN